MNYITEMLDLFYANKHLYKKIGGKEKDMGEYVKKDEILKVIKDWEKIDVGGEHMNDETPVFSHNDWMNWKVEFYHDVVNAMDELPMVEVVHGEWKELPNQNEHLARGLHKFVCSICGSGMYGEPNYCPHCGARMDL